MPQVFISHSSKDLDFVRTRLQPLLDELGMAAWCSASDIRMAADWERQIRAALAQADWFVVVLSPDAQISEWVQAETHWALEHKRGRVIPLMARDCTPEQIHLRLGTLQYVDFRRDPEFAAARLRALLSVPDPWSATRIASRAQPESSCGATLITEQLSADLLLSIEPTAGPGYEQRLRVRGPMLIGRLAEADLHLPDECVSRRHAKLCVGRSDSGPIVTLTDLDSANGTYVNRERLLSSRTLAAGDLVELGNVRVLVQRIEYSQ